MTDTPSSAPHDNTHPDALNWDFHGPTRFTVHGGPHNARGRITLTPETVDEHARIFFGDHQCHRLAAALACATGQTVVTVQRRDGRELWPGIHSAATTGPDTVLDINGAASRDELTQQWRSRHRGSLLRLREFTPGQMPTDVVADMSHYAGDPWWWTAGAPEVVATIAHFARLLLTGRGGRS